MAENDIILVNEQARDIVRNLEKNASESAVTTAVTGANSSVGAAQYRAAMGIFMGSSKSIFNAYMRVIRTECATAIAAIDDLNQQDQEIVALLNKYDAEIAATNTGTTSPTAKW